MIGYSVEIIETSKDLTARERIQAKDTTDAIPLDEATQKDNGFCVFTPSYWVRLKVHNEKSDNKEYVKYVIVDTDGVRYVTGSESFYTAFREIFDEMCGTDEEYQVKAYRVPSKNYKGKEFMSCSIM